jgi:coatomer subunit beta
VVLALILGGDFFTGSVLASTLTKLVLRFDDLMEDRPKANALRAEVRALVKVFSTVY